MDIGANNWNETDDSNSSAAPDGAPEGMPPSGLNNTMRAMMGALKRWWNQNVPKATGGTATAYTLSYGVAPGALVDGMTHLVQFNAASGASPTLNVNSLGAKPLYIWNGSAWAQVTDAGTIPANLVARVSYNQTEGSYRIVSSAATAIGAAFLAIANTFAATLTMNGAAINEAVRVDVASATPAIGAAASNYIRITGTTTIAAFDTVPSGIRRHVLFGGALTLTYDGTAMILPGGADLAVAAGDTATFMSEGGGHWRCIDFQRASGAPLGGLGNISAALNADVPLNSTGNYFDGPSVAQGSAGTWFVSGTVTIFPVVAGGRTNLKLWDGTTVLASASVTYEGPATPTCQAVSLSGVITNPAGNLRISAKNLDSTSALILANQSGNGKDSSITAIRIS